MITGEWVTFWATRGTFGRFRTLASVLPATTPFYAYNDQSAITYSVVEPNSVMNANVSSPFTFQADSIIYGTETQLLPKPGATVFYDSDNLGIGVLGWDYGYGRVISFSTMIGISELSSSDYRQLLSNAIRWSARGVCTGTIPGDVNDDCKVDFADFAIMVSNRLECNLEPQSRCWQ